jgi:hypothetical protein
LGFVKSMVKKTTPHPTNNTRVLFTEKKEFSCLAKNSPSSKREFCDNFKQAKPAI